MRLRVATARLSEWAVDTGADGVEPSTASLTRSPLTPMTAPSSGCSTEHSPAREWSRRTGARTAKYSPISDLASRLRDATGSGSGSGSGSGECHAVGLIHDFANNHATVAEACAELAAIESGHV